MSGVGPTHRPVPAATVARLPSYLRALTHADEGGVSSMSSEELAAAAGVSSAMLRKDLSQLGSYGVRGVGYEVSRLASEISLALGLGRERAVAIVGMGNLGRALAAYRGFAHKGFHVEALLDRAPEVVGTRIGDRLVEDLTDLADLTRGRALEIGVIATPAESAQEVADALVAAGITSILNFAPVVLTVPDGVDVRQVDLSTEVQILAFHAQRRHHGDPRPLPEVG